MTPTEIYEIQGAEVVLDELPRFTYAFIDLLDKAYPPRCIGVNETPEQAHRYAGLREFVDHLVSLKAEELEAITEVQDADTDRG